MIQRLITQRLPTIGLVGIAVTYWFLADSIPKLAAFSHLVVISENLLIVRGLYIVLSALLAILTMLSPAKWVFIIPSIFFLAFFIAILMGCAIATFIGVFWVLSLMIGLNFEPSPVAIDWVLILSGFATPVMFLNGLAALLVTTTQRGLKPLDFLNQWEIILLLVGASWLGLALGWWL